MKLGINGVTLTSLTKLHYSVEAARAISTQFCTQFWARKRGYSYPSPFRERWRQNKWSILLGRAAEKGDAARSISVQFLATSLFSRTMHSVLTGP